MGRVARRGHDDLGGVIEVVVDDLDLLGHLHAVVSNLVEPAHERAHVRRARLRDEQALGRGENQRRVRLDPLLVEDLDRLHAILEHGNFDHDILVHLHQLPRLLHHPLTIRAHHLRTDRPVADRADLLEQWDERLLRVGDMRRICRHAVENTPVIGLADLVDIGGVQKELHRRTPEKV